MVRYRPKVPKKGRTSSDRPVGEADDEAGPVAARAAVGPVPQVSDQAAGAWSNGLLWRSSHCRYADTRRAASRYAASSSS